MKKNMKLKIREIVEQRTVIIKYLEIDDDDDDVLSFKKIDEEFTNDPIESDTISLRDYQQDDDDIEGQYSLEEMYLEAMGYSNDMTIVTWPDSQEYMEKPWFKEEAQLINDDFGLEHFGSSAYIIPLIRTN